MNLAYVGIYSNTLEKGMLICSLLKMSKKRLYYLSLSFFLLLSMQIRKMFNWWMVYYNFIFVSGLFPWFLLLFFIYQFLFHFFTSHSLSLFSFSFSTSLLFFSPLSFKPTTVPYLVVIELDCSFDLICVFAEKDPLPCSESCVASCLTWTSRFLMEASMFFWFMMDFCIN